ncbi:LOW QUALITY PROTEIN: BTB/POZ domain-containing protein 9 [Lepeophtheirus salmonis]|uniref:BTB/POZ domain-containing protein 9 n=1 Tax=Lepeophtheirus salmonis TaxID=72036 RepID=A0A0K2T9T9_LEPSM|nr:LOW QUALITY PROTEIN: BTB/POZ domain-containing protein 9-like [Lepeophtheirus salmonis]
MSSQQPINPRTPSEIQHTQFVAEDVGSLYLSEEYSDVTLIVDGQRFPGHKVLLASRSKYFKAMLYGGMRESHSEEIELKDTPVGAFKYLLCYVYTGNLSLGHLSDDTLIEILELADIYGFQNLETAISEYLESNLNEKNVCYIYDTASLYSLPCLSSACLTFIDQKAYDVIKDESFTSLSPTALKNIVSRDSFCAAEVDIFKAIVHWAKANPCDGGHGDILQYIRLPLMSTADLLNVVRPSGFINSDVILDAIQSKISLRDMELKYRGYLIPEENVATQKYNASVIAGELKHALLDGNSKRYDSERGFTRHRIDKHEDQGIIIQLGMQYTLNLIRMLLWDREQRSYSYYIEVSMDQKDWYRVIDHSKYVCRSWQQLYFHPKVVKYIRIFGTHNSHNDAFQLVSFEAYYTKKPFELNKEGICIPRFNVATIPMSACVIEGVSRTRDALLNGDTDNYDWDSGYTCHQLGSGAIAIQLGQPYALSSIRLRLWDCDSRFYSYYVEVSENNKDWDMVCDRSKVDCRSWQTITFPQKVVSFVRIVGTRNTVNQIFHVVHFECPGVTEILQNNYPTSPTNSVSSEYSVNSGANTSTGGIAGAELDLDNGSPILVPVGANDGYLAPKRNQSSGGEDEEEDLHFDPLAD